MERLLRGQRRLVAPLPVLQSSAQEPVARPGALRRGYPATIAQPAALGALVLYGVGTSVGNVSFSSLIQSHVAGELRGRVFSAFDLIWQTMRLASLPLGGLIADTYGIRIVFYAGGALLLAAAFAGVSAGGATRVATNPA